jgi:hypothetical protein
MLMQTITTTKLMYNKGVAENYTSMLVIYENGKLSPVYIRKGEGDNVWETYKKLEDQGIKVEESFSLKIPFDQQVIDMINFINILDTETSGIQEKK